MKVEHRVEIVTSAIEVGDLMSWLNDSRSGAICTFTGTTREWTGKDQTFNLLYECYEEMALKEMEKLIEFANERWSPNRVCLIHRIGEVGIAEASVFVGVSSAHRSESFEAARFLIDELKKEVPIWKKDFDPDGKGEWK